MNGFQIIGLLIVLAPFVWYWWEFVRTRDWLTTEARVIEVDRQSLFERTGNEYYLNLDKDYAIEYLVNGNLYVQTPDIENNIRVGGIKIHKEPSIPEYFQIRYNPNNPNDYSLANAYSKLFIVVVFGFAFVFGACLALKLL